MELFDETHEKVCIACVKVMLTSISQLFDLQRQDQHQCPKKAYKVLFYLRNQCLNLFRQITTDNGCFLV